MQAMEMKYLLAVKTIPRRDNRKRVRGLDYIGDKQLG